MPELAVWARGREVLWEDDGWAVGSQVGSHAPPEGARPHPCVEDDVLAAAAGQAAGRAEASCEEEGEAHRSGVCSGYR